ncbi:MAG: GntR family transcriptional regulator [Nocardioides sp.]
MVVGSAQVFYAFTMIVDKDAEPADRASPIAFTLDPGSGVPTYLQLVQQVEQALRLGYLRPGDQLPKVREVVADLAINPNTVMKAYRDLEGKGLTAGRPGLGTFVETTVDRVDLAGLTVLRTSLLTWIAEAEGAGLGRDGVIALFSRTVRDFYERREPEGARGDRPAGRRTGGGVA